MILTLTLREVWTEYYHFYKTVHPTKLIHKFFHRVRPSEAHLTLNGPNIPFASHVKYLRVIFEKRITWRLRLDVIEGKAFRVFISLFSYSKVSD
jgi:hypothetical protein